MAPHHTWVVAPWWSAMGQAWLAVGQTHLALEDSGCSLAKKKKKKKRVRM